MEGRIEPCVKGHSIKQKFSITPSGIYPLGRAGASTIPDRWSKGEEKAIRELTDEVGMPSPV